MEAFCHNITHICIAIQKKENKDIPRQIGMHGGRCIRKAMESSVILEYILSAMEKQNHIHTMCDITIQTKVIGGIIV